MLSLKLVRQRKSNMLENITSFLRNALYVVPAILISLTFHEFGHAYAAYKMGDPTARNLGRMTLNPLAHIDPVGFILLVLFGFGWAKPVPVNPRNYNNFKKGEIVVSLAGVTMNLILAVLGAMILYTLLAVNGYNKMMKDNVLSTIAIILYYFVGLNCGLIVFNLIPIPPLDGSHVIITLFGKNIPSSILLNMQRYGSIILVAAVLVCNRLNFSPVGIVSGWLQNGIYGLMKLIFIH